MSKLELQCVSQESVLSKIQEYVKVMIWGRLWRVKGIERFVQQVLENWVGVRLCVIF